MIFESHITKSRIRIRSIYIKPVARNLLTAGTTSVSLPDGTSIAATSKPFDGVKNMVVHCPNLYRTNTACASLPLRLGDYVVYEVRRGRIHITEIRRPAGITSTHQAPIKKILDARSRHLQPPLTAIPKLGQNASPNDVIQELVKWIHRDPFQRQSRFKRIISAVPCAPIIMGWHERIKEYAYAKSRDTNFGEAYADTRPMIRGLAKLARFYKLSPGGSAKSPSAKYRAKAKFLAKQVCVWGAVPQKRGYSKAWKVIRAALTSNTTGAPMNSGWTKVASLATDGLMTNSQTIWDSRVSTAIIWRLDQILHTNGRDLYWFGHSDLGIVCAKNSGTRPRHLNLPWRNGYGKWDSHYAGATIVRQIVDVLNSPTNRYPRMPQPNGASKDWDVFGVGLVLFMDGY